MAQPAEVSAFDQLTLIDGIDPTIERVLNGIAIRRYADLAAQTPEFLAEALQRVHIPISVEAIAEQNWIGRAHQLADVHLGLASTGSEEVKERQEQALPDVDAGKLDDNERIVETATASVLRQQEAVAPADLPAQEGDARDKAPDIRETKTKPSAHTPSAARALQAAKVMNSAAAADEASAAPPVAPPLASTPVPSAMELHIRRARFMQKDSSSPEKQGEKTLHGEITCELVHDGELSKSPETMALYTQVHAVNLNTGGSELLASKSQTVLPRINDYSVAIDFKIPPAGRYQLQVVAFLIGATPLLDIYRGPVLRVES
jgi:hypothetical protein